MLLLSAGLVAQSTQRSLLSQSQVGGMDPGKRSFVGEAEKNNINFLKLAHLQNVKEGYYMVLNHETKAEKAVLNRAKKLLKDQYKSGSILDTENDLVYSYVNYTSSWQEALNNYNSIREAAADDMWLLHIDNSSTNADSVPLEDVTYELLTAAIENPQTDSSDAIYQKAHDTSKSKVNSGKSRLIQKADSYFDKMWYSEAANLYEEALKNKQDNYSFEIIQKTADAHYFNTNMERACHWYTILYENFKDNLSADNIFKYAHSLKGSGKYARSKKLMNLYNENLEKTPKNLEGGILLPSRHEIVLDKILNTKANAELKNLAINTEYSDFSPMYYNTDELVFSSAKDSLFISTRQYKWTNQPYLDLYVAKINEETQDTKDAVKFSKKINSQYHEASVTFSSDNTTMYFTRNNYSKKVKRDKNGINHLKIYKSVKVDGQWTNPTELPFNSDDYSTGHPALSPDGKKLYFVSDMPGSLGMTDIFVVDILPDGTYSNPKNLGPEINTEKKEMFPFINEDKLYFSSDGHVGLGGLDIFEARYSEENGFTTPTNLGIPINSNKDDFSYIVNESTQKGFFASNREGGKGDDDIYSFTFLLPEEVVQNAISGVITELVSGDVLPKSLITLLDENNIKLKEMYNSADGSFVFEDLESDTKYTIQITTDGFQTETRIVETQQNKTIQMEQIALRKLHDNIIVDNGIRKFKTENILFGFDKFHINQESSVELDKLVSALKENPEMIIKIESHTDSRGSNEYNKYLSDRRAKASMDYVISKGIDSSRIESAIGYGEERLLNECDGSIRCTEAEHLQNRRSEFIIVKI